MSPRSYKLGRKLPKFIRNTARSLLGRYYSFRSYELSGPLQGYKMIGYLEIAYQEGTYEMDICSALEDLIHPGWNCADVGAFVGYFTLLMAKNTGNEGKVYAFEANSDSCEILSENVAINNLSKIVIVENLAISDSDQSSIRLFSGDKPSPEVWSIINDKRNSNGYQTVAAASLDGYFRDIERLDLVKIDVEGAEGLVIRGMTTILKELRPWILLEFHSEEAWRERHLLSDSGYQIYDVKKRSRLSKDTAQRVYHCLAGPEEKVASFA